MYYGTVNGRMFFFLFFSCFSEAGYCRRRRPKVDLISDLIIGDGVRRQRSLSRL